MSKKPLAPLLDADEVATLLGVSKSLIYKLTHQDEIPRVYIRGGAMRFDQSEVLAWLKAQPRRRRSPRRAEVGVQ